MTSEDYVRRITHIVRLGSTQYTEYLAAHCRG